MGDRDNQRKTGRERVRDMIMNNDFTRLKPFEMLQVATNFTGAVQKKIGLNATKLRACELNLNILLTDAIISVAYAHHMRV